MTRPWSSEPFWARLSEPEAAEKLFEWSERSARIEFDDGLSRGFAEVSAYIAMTVHDSSSWSLLEPKELARLRFVSGILDLHHARVGGASKVELEAIRSSWREQCKQMREALTSR
jgi:hypothetical protein